VRENPSARTAQKTLAREVTAIVHGEDRASSAERVTSVLFGDGSVADLSDDDLALLAAEIPVLEQGVSVVDALVNQGAATSNGDARRLIEGGAVTVNGLKLEQDMIMQQRSLIKKGKNSFILVC